VNLPVIIHSRDATKDTLDILKEYKPKGVVHCFSGSAETALEMVNLGLYIGFTGVITFKNASRAIEALKVIPLDKLLCETDCPYMAPEPHRGKRNDPSLLCHIIEKMASVKGVTPQEMADITNQNARRLFNL
jgi:TatD DNase family protein